MTELNLKAAWVAILLGALLGGLQGLFFHREQWLGGYGSWPRRLMRLGHIAFLGTGLLNLAFALSVEYHRLPAVPPLASGLLVVGGVTMPTVCFLAAWRDRLRHLFAVPVLSLIGGVADLLWQVLSTQS